MGEESVLLSEQTRREKREIEITRLGWMNGLGLEWERAAVMTGAAMCGRCRCRLKHVWSRCGDSVVSIYTTAYPGLRYIVFQVGHGRKTEHGAHGLTVLQCLR